MEHHKKQQQQQQKNPKKTKQKENDMEQTQNYRPKIITTLSSAIGCG